MIEGETLLLFLVLLVGITLILSILIKAALDGELLSISMIPRAEIAMIIMERGRQLGDWAVSSQIFTSMILVSVITCIASPMLLRPLLQNQST